MSLAQDLLQIYLHSHSHPIVVGICGNAWRMLSIRMGVGGTRTGESPPTSFRIQRLPFLSLLLDFHLYHCIPSEGWPSPSRRAYTDLRTSANPTSLFLCAATRPRFEHPLAVWQIFHSSHPVTPEGSPSFSLLLSGRRNRAFLE